MSTKLRGKHLNIIKPQTHYAKVPLEVLAHPKLTPVDKLIICYLFSQSDSGNYILAYTRIAKELSISKKWIIERWKWLKENGYIVEDSQNYYIIFNTPKGEQNTPIDESNMVNKIHPIGEHTSPTIGEQNTPTKVNKVYLNGEQSIPNEYNEEENIKIEHKIEHSENSEDNFEDDSINLVDEKINITPSNEVNKISIIDLPIKIRNEVDNYKSSSLFTKVNMFKIINEYETYNRIYPNDFITIHEFEKYSFYLMYMLYELKSNIEVNKKMLYDIPIELLKKIPELIEILKDNKERQYFNKICQLTLSN